MTAFFAGEMIFRTGFASSCSPRAFIMSTIFCGRGTIVSLCMPGGVALVVAVVLVLLLVCWQPASASSAAKQRLKNNREVFGILMAPPERLLYGFYFTALSQKAGRAQALPFLLPGRLESGLTPDQAGGSPLLNSNC